MVDSTGRTLQDLDRIDRQILDELQRDGRLSVAEIARRVSLSTTPCVERIHRLEREGIIAAYIARLDWRALGYDVLAFIEVSLDRTNPDFFARFRGAVALLDEVRECYMVAGNFDYLLKVQVTSMASFQRFLVDRLTALPGLQQTHTYFTLEVIKSETSLPLLQPRTGRAASQTRPQRQRLNSTGS